MNSRNPLKEQSEKLDFTLMPVEFMDVVKILMFGIKKGYEPNGWLEGKKFNSATNNASMMRHLLDIKKGKFIDHESGLEALLHLGCRALMEYTVRQRAGLISDKGRQELVDRGFSDKSIASIERGLKHVKENKVHDYDDVSYIDSLEFKKTHEFCLQTRQSQMSGHNNDHLDHRGDCPDNVNNISLKNKALWVISMIRDAKVPSSQFLPWARSTFHLIDWDNRDFRTLDHLLEDEIVNKYLDDSNESQ